MEWNLLMDFLNVKDNYYVVTGVANNRSIAWGMAKTLHEAGAKLIFTYRKERSKEKLSELIEKEMPGQNNMVYMDVLEDSSVAKAFEEIKSITQNIRGVIHSIAFANREELQGEYVDTSREGYHLAQNSSAYSLVVIAKEAKKLMPEGGNIVTVSYLGGERVVQNYNVMGVAKAALEASVKYLANDLGKYNIRVNSISAGPIRTLAAKGISGFNDILKDIEEKSPLRKTVSKEDCGKTALYLLSDLSTGVTGENIHVDGGYHILGF